MIELAASLAFGAQGNAAGHLGGGWAAPESGFCWSIGPRATLDVPLPPAADLAGLAHDLMLEIELNPFTAARLPAQRLELHVNALRIDAGPIVGEGTLGWRLPGLTNAPALHIELATQDAARPADLGVGGDQRQLGFMVRQVRVMRVPPLQPCAHRVLPPRPEFFDPSLVGQTERFKAAVLAATGHAAEIFMLNFESLGHNCEFGLVQRHMGAEPLGLLRFAGISLPRLLDGLDWGFAGIADPQFVSVRAIGTPRAEFIVRNERYDLGIHSFKFAGETDSETVRRDQLGQLGFFHRKFMEVLETGERIFVFQRPGQFTTAQMRPLLTLLQSYGPNRLLCVTESNQAPPGTVTELEPGLAQGHIDQLAPAGRPGDANLSAWLSLLINAAQLLPPTGDPA